MSSLQPNRSHEQSPQIVQLFNSDPPSRTEGVFISDDTDRVPDLNIPTHLMRGKEKIGDTVVRCHLIVPDEVLDPVPLAIAPGYLGDSWAYQGLGNYIARNGKPVLLWKFPRRLGVRGTIDPSHALYPQKLACQALWGSIKHLQSFEDLHDIDQSKVDAAGHSRGGPTIVRAADKKPHVFRNLILDGAAGLEDHNTWMMLGRLGPFFKDEALPSLKERKMRQPAHIALLGLTAYVFGNLPRTAMEAIDVSNEDIVPLLAKFQHSDKHKHIGRAIYGGNSDKLINIHRSIERAGAYADITQIHDDQELGHLGPQIKPESVGRDYLNIIKKLEAMKSASVPPLTRAA